MTRSETFTDGAFAFPVTALVIAGGKVSDLFEALIASLQEIPAFGANLANVFLFFWALLIWSRRLGLENGPAVALSGPSILAILIYAVPLKVLLAEIFTFFSGGRTRMPLALLDPQQLD